METKNIEERKKKPKDDLEWQTLAFLNIIKKWWKYLNIDSDE